MIVVDKNSSTTGFFGKLPKFADFVKLNSGGNEILIMDTWIQEGLAAAKSRFKNDWKNYFENAPIINFIFPFTGTDKIIIGVIKSSQDKSGRQFPIILFTIMARNSFNGMPFYLFPINYKNALISFRDLIQNNFESESLDDLKSALNSFTHSQTDVNSFADEYQKHITYKTAESILNFIEDKSDLNTLIGNRLSFTENSAGTKILLSADSENEFLNLCFITEMLLTIFPSQSLIPALFWKRISIEKIVLFLFTQKPSPSNFVDIFYPDREQEGFELQSKSNKIFDDTTIVYPYDSLLKLISATKSALKK